MNLVNGVLLDPWDIRRLKIAFGPHGWFLLVKRTQLFGHNQKIHEDSGLGVMEKEGIAGTFYA